MKAQVYKIHSDFYYVKTETDISKNAGNGLIECKLREILKKQKIKVKVGDFVEIEKTGFITALLERKNTLCRPSVSNLDTVVVVSSLMEPAVDFIQLNRYLTFLKYNKIEALLCFNKDDLMTKKELEKAKKEICLIYKPLKYKILFTSALYNNGLDEFADLIKNKTIAFSGMSGVGKSSILNAIANKNLKTGNVSLKNKRGTHTTRHAEIIEFNETKIIDTPGFSKLAFDFLLPKDLTNLFDDIKIFAKNCKYKDCLHTREDDDCNVIKNLDKISSSRYESYIRFLAETREYKQKITYESKKKETAVKNFKEKNFVKISSKKRSLSRKSINQTTKNFYYENNGSNND